MTTQYPWAFEPCSPEDVCDPTGTPWAHAVRGRKPQRPVVMGYGNTPNAADADARTKASQQDAREVLGARGEVVTPQQYTLQCALGTNYAVRSNGDVSWIGNPHEPPYPTIAIDGYGTISVMPWSLDT